MTHQQAQIFANFQYFAVVAEAGSMAAAARKLHVTQPTISIAIKHLETELGTQLIERHSYGVRLTTAGRQFLHDMSTINSAIDLSVDRLRRSTKGRDHCLSIGTKPVFLASVWPNILSTIANSNPNVLIQLGADTRNSELERQLDERTIDAALMPLDSGKKRFQDYKLFDETFGLFRTATSTNQQNRIFIMRGALVGPAITINVFKMIARDSNYSIIELPDYASVLSMVNLGQGYGLLPLSISSLHQHMNEVANFPSLVEPVSKMKFPVGFRVLSATCSSDSMILKVIRAAKRAQNSSRLGKTPQKPDKDRNDHCENKIET